MEESVKYIHEEMVHNLNDPGIIVPIIIDVLHPKCVVDMGCGLGTFLHVFEEHGIKDVMGLDGKWVDKNKLSQNIDLKKFQEIDIEKGFNIQRRFDIAICLEVLEHVSPEFANQAVSILTGLSDIIVFSAAIPGQVGQNHVNEQWADYWEEKFRAQGYSFHDVFRPIFWNNKNVARWYKQNMFLVVKDTIQINIDDFRNYEDKVIKNYVHPDYFLIIFNQIDKLVIQQNELVNEINKIKSGEKRLIFYLKLLLRFVLKKQPK
jgi:SAM-dependent methyltransferase